jgi:short-subunit dehydrogenase
VRAVLPGFVETAGFPQRGVLPPPLSWTIIEPDRVARAVVHAIRWRRREVFVPWWYRFVALLQGLAPGLVARVLALGDYRPAA